MIPRGTPGVWGAAGTTGTCTAQGFFTQFSFGSGMYNCALAVYYLLVIRHGWTEDHFRNRKWVQLLMLAGPAFYVLLTGFIGLALDLFNSAMLWCYYANYPAGCSSSGCADENSADTCIPCTRGRSRTRYTAGCVITFLCGRRCL